jgi:hypothetical protein
MKQNTNLTVQTGTSFLFCTMKQLAFDNDLEIMLWPMVLYVASGLCEEGDTGDVYEMPADLDIEVEAIALDEYEQEALRGDTK